MTVQHKAITAMLDFLTSSRKACFKAREGGGRAKLESLPCACALQK